MKRNVLTEESKITFFHLAALMPLAYFTHFHFTQGVAWLAVGMLISAVLITISVVFVFLGRPWRHYDLLILTSVVVNLVSATYVVGLRPMYYLFPSIMGIYFNYSERFSTIVSVLLSLACFAAALNTVPIEILQRLFLPVAITIMFALFSKRIITKQRDDLEIEANVDHLTGVYNRRNFHEWLERAIQIYVNQANKIAVFYLDIDDFKRANDIYGHSFGDKLLTQFTQSIQRSVRATDAVSIKGENRFARLAGDEFVVASTNIKHEQDALTIAKRLLAEINRPVIVEGIEFQLNSSIGIALCHSADESAEKVIHNADSAMYKSKADGKNRITFFDDAIAQAINRKNTIAEAIREALANNEFHLVFMPMFKEKGKIIAGAETLIRCRSEKLRGIGPDEYIPVAEEYGLIQAIDLFVVTETFKVAQANLAYLPQDFTFSINFSANELHNENFPKKLKSLSKTYNISPKNIEFEITETSLVSHDVKTLQILNDIKSIGFRLSLDDFGTGYTAFSQLQLYPVDTLKIDRSFVWAIDDSVNQNTTMVDVILKLAALYDVKIVAEGIENQKQLDYLADSACDYYQGFYLSKPLDWKTFQQSYCIDAKPRINEEGAKAN